MDRARKLVDITSSFSNDIHVIVVNSTRNKFHNHMTANNKKCSVILYELTYKSGKNFLTRILRYFFAQLWISLQIFKVHKKANFWIFDLGDELILPMLVAKILQRKVVLIIGGSMEKELAFKNDSLAKILIPIKKINCNISDIIILYSKNLIKEWNLKRYINKISIAHRHYLDFNKFKIQKLLGDRERVVGYIGRLSEEKGILNFIQAIPKVLDKEDVHFMIVGNGTQLDEIKYFINKNGLIGKVKILCEAPHDDIPRYLNELKLLVLPSYTEGLPNIILEAMACGTPVLATPIGAIPDIVKDFKTGFLLRNNSPECIAESIIKALHYTKLDEIVKNALELVCKKFNYEVAVKKWEKIFLKILNC